MVFKKGDIPWISGREHSLETKQKISNTKKRMFASGQFVHPMLGRSMSFEARQKISETKKRMFANGQIARQYGNMHWKGKKHSEDTKAKMSLARLLWHEQHPGFIAGENNPMYGMVGELSLQWNGGSLFEPYDESFNESFKEYIRNFYGRLCMICFKAEHRRKLSVHHIDYNKLNSRFENLVPVHHGCHCKTNALEDRGFWNEYFKQVVRSMK